MSNVTFLPYFPILFIDKQIDVAKHEMAKDAIIMDFYMSKERQA